MAYKYAVVSRNLGRRVHELRLARGLTYRNMEVTHKFYATQWMRIERGTHTFSLKTLLQLADIFGMTVEELVKDLED